LIFILVDETHYVAIKLIKNSVTDFINRKEILKQRENYNKNKSEIYSFVKFLDTC